MSVRDLADILRNDPVVTLRYQHRNRRKMREATERISAVMGKTGAAPTVNGRTDDKLVVGKDSSDA